MSACVQAYMRVIINEISKEFSFLPNWNLYLSNFGTCLMFFLTLDVYTHIYLNSRAECLGYATCQEEAKFRIQTAS